MGPEILSGNLTLRVILTTNPPPFFGDVWVWTTTSNQKTWANHDINRCWGYPYSIPTEATIGRRTLRKLRHLDLFWSRIKQHSSFTCREATSLWHLGGSTNGGTLKQMVYNGKSDKHGWFGGTLIYGNHHFNVLKCAVRTTTVAVNLYWNILKKHWFSMYCSNESKAICFKRDEVAESYPEVPETWWNVGDHSQHFPTGELFEPLNLIEAWLLRSAVAICIAQKWMIGEISGPILRNAPLFGMRYSIQCHMMSLYFPCLLRQSNSAKPHPYSQGPHQESQDRWRHASASSQYVWHLAAAAPTMQASHPRFSSVSLQKIIISASSCATTCGSWLFPFSLLRMLAPKLLGSRVLAKGAHEHPNERHWSSDWTRITMGTFKQWKLEWKFLVSMPQ